MEPVALSLTIPQALALADRRYKEGDLAEAQSLCRQILEHEPHHGHALELLKLLVDLHYQRGTSFALAGNAEQAATEFQLALAIHPNDPQVLNNLGNALQQTGQCERAVEAYRRALAVRPDYAGAWSNLGKALEESGSIDEAIEAYRKAIALRPDFPEAHYNLGNALRMRDRLDDAIEAYERALALRPNHAATHSNLGNALKDAGRIDEAIAHYRRAWDLGADARAAGNLLYCLRLHPDYSPAQINEEHARWNERYARRLAPTVGSFANDRSPDRRLRIGYVSPDFCEHPVGRFMAPLLSHHDHGHFEVFCYADVRRADRLTERLRSHADLWRETADLSDEQLAALILQDRIDLLIDLSMHTSRNRLLVFARKPAPVQATYLSYCGTTGLETMDYRLTDPFLDPPGEIENYSERSVRLPKTFWCYEPPDVAPPVQPPPALTSGHVTFGCFNQFCKVSRPALSTWCALLRQLPNSRLVLHAPEGSARDRTRQAVAHEGIDPDRVRFVGRAPLHDYLEQHRLIDIALDPFPFAGGTTTCDALWMGVAVVSLRGQTAVSRAGASILSNIGLSDLVANSPEEYIRIAADLAADLPRLTQLRETLRDRMRAAPLMDARRFAGDVEAAYRTMWQDWWKAPR